MPFLFPSTGNALVNAVAIPARRRRQRILLGVVLPTGNGRWRVCPAWGCGAPPVIRGCYPGDVNPPAGMVWNQATCSYVFSGAPLQATGPVPVGFPTNQLFMAPDGSQWAYSVAQGKWINVGTPYDLSNASTPPPTSTSTPTTVAPAPVSVTVATTTPAAPTSSPYQSIIDFATQSSLITGVPNWLVGVGILLGFKVVEGMSGGKRRNPERRRARQ